jgi:hypothetical protein
MATVRASAVRRPATFLCGRLVDSCFVPRKKATTTPNQGGAQSVESPNTPNAFRFSELSIDDVDDRVR